MINVYKTLITHCNDGLVCVVCSECLDCNTFYYQLRPYLRGSVYALLNIIFKKMLSAVDFSFLHINFLII